MSRLPIEGKGLTAKGKGNLIFSTTLKTTANASQLYNKVTSQSNDLVIIAEPNKCSFSNSAKDIVYCGYQLNDKYDNNFPDNWYMGTKSFNDRIWSINLNDYSATQLISPEKETGRQIDIIDMTNSSDGQVLYFRNKNDNTLWMYEI